MKTTKVRVGVDPNSDNVENIKKIHRVLKALGPSESKVIPTFLLSLHSDRYYERMPLSMKENIEENTVYTIRKKLSNLGIEDWAQPNVYTSDYLTGREEIVFLADILEADECDLFVVNTHARKGIQRMFLGSFAENLLLKYNRPMLFVSPNTEPEEKIDKVLFPTDFSERSFKVFKSYLQSPFAKGKQVEVFSMTKYFKGSLTLTNYGGYSAVERFIKESHGHKVEVFEKWNALAKEFEIEASLSIEDNLLDLTEAILDKANNINAQLIVMGSFVGDKEVIFTGSHTRELIRNSELPVLVWHTK